MLLTNIIIGVVIGLILAVPIIAWRARYRDVFGAILVLGIVALAAAVTVYRIQDYDQHKTLSRAEATAPQAGPAYGSSVPPPPATIPRGPRPMVGATGAAAPPPASAPRLGAGK